MKNSWSSSPWRSSPSAARRKRPPTATPSGVETVTNQFGSTDLQMIAESMARSCCRRR